LATGSRECKAGAIKEKKRKTGWGIRFKGSARERRGKVRSIDPKLEGRRNIPEKNLLRKKTDDFNYRR